MNLGQKRTSRRIGQLGIGFNEESPRRNRNRRKPPSTRSNRETPYTGRGRHTEASVQNWSALRRRTLAGGRVGVGGVLYVNLKKRHPDVTVSG